jgi:hypothetical protein
VHLVLRQAEHTGDAVAREMRLLRAGPQGGAVGPRIDDGASRTHAGMRLERPLVFRLDDPRCAGESRVDVAQGDRHLALDDGRLTDVLVECGIFGKGRRFQFTQGAELPKDTCIPGIVFRGRPR